MIYLLRHGQTDWNLSHRLQGRTDIPLNETGRQMAREAGLKYRNVSIDVCYCSPLCRARETAELFLQGRNLEIRCDERLTEFSFGPYEGIDDYFGDANQIGMLFRNPEKFLGAEGVETLDSLIERTESFLTEVAIPLSKCGKNVLLVSHGGASCAMIHNVKHTELRDFWKVLLQNCELYCLME